MPIFDIYLKLHGSAALSKLLPLLMVLIPLTHILVKFNSNKILAFIILFFLTNTGVVVNSSSNNIKASSFSKPSTAKLDSNSFEVEKFKEINSVYLLIYDGYVPNETMLSYGIDNSAQEDFLSAEGFDLYKNIYSVAAQSIPTMGRVLNITETDSKLHQATAGDSLVFNYFKGNGYETAGYFKNTYFFRGADINYDKFYPKIDRSGADPLEVIYKSIASGYFGFDIGFDEFSYEDFLRNKESYFKERRENPRFIYTHTGPGHAAFTGKCLFNETQRFASRLETANREMRQDVANIITNDPDAIIVIAGDHGPYLNKNCTQLNNVYSSDEVDRYDLQDRYGTFLAVKMPNGHSIPVENITVLQDIFPEILNFLTSSSKFDTLKIKPTTAQDVTSGVIVDNGIIRGGKNDGEPLFIENSK